MSARSPVGSIRSETPLALALALYAALSLISMATMSLGMGAVIGALLWSCGGPQGVIRVLRSEWAGASREARLFGIASLSFWLAGLWSLLLAVIFPSIIAGAPYHVHPLQDAAKSWYFLWPFLLAIGLRRITGPQRAHVLRAWLGVFLAVSVIGCIQFFTGWPRPQAIPTFPGKFHSTLFIGHHLSVVSIWIFPFFVALEAAFAKTAKRSEAAWLPRWVLALASGFGLAVLVLAFSRTGWVAIGVATLIWGLARIPAAYSRYRLGIIAGFGLVLAGLWQWEPVQVRLRNSMGVSEREQLWRESWQFFLARPWGGVGWQNTQDAVRQLRAGQGFIGHAHSMPLELLSSMGAPGFLAYGFWWVAAFLVFRRLTADPGLARMGLTFRAMAAASIAFLINGLTQVNFWDGKVLHQLMWTMGLALAFSSLSRMPEEARS